MPIVCPIDGKDDAVQKVTAIVKLGTGEGNFSGPTGGVAYAGGKWGVVSGYTTMRGWSISQLARTVAAPARPRQPRGLGTGPWIGLIAGGLVCAAVAGGFACNTLPFAVLLEGAESWLICVPVVLVAMACAVAFLVGAGFFLKANTKARKADEVRYAGEKRAWDDAMEVYDRLYYCSRHDLVFDSATGETCRPEDTQRFCYRAGAAP